MKNLNVPSQRVAPFSREGIHILHISLCDCSVKTELVCRDNYAKNSLNRFQIGCIVYRQFSMSFAFELTSGQWCRSTEKLDIRFQRIPIASFLQFSYTSSVIISLEFVFLNLRLTFGEDLLFLSVQQSSNLCVFSV